MIERLPNRLRAARVAAGFTNLKSFADLVNMPMKRYRLIENGREAPTLDELSFIAQITNKTLDFLVRGTCA